MMREFVTRNLFFGNTEKHDQGTAHRIGVPSHEAIESAADNRNCNPCGERRGNCTDYLTRLHNSTPRLNFVTPDPSTNVVNLAADSKLASEPLIVFDKSQPEASHPARRPCQPGSTNSDAQRCVISGA